MGNTNFTGPVISENGFIGKMTVTAGGSSTPLVSGGGVSPGVYAGSGAPTISAPQGSLYLNTTGNSTSTRAYINSNGGTTWVAVTTAT